MSVISHEMSFERAKKLYFRAAEREVAEQGEVLASVPMPANTSEMIDGVWHLENCNGPLARVFPDGRVDFD